MLSIFTRKRIPHPTAPGLVRYHAGATFGPGMENMVPELTVGNPVISFSGPGTVVGDRAVLPGRPFIQHLALMVDPPQGIPVGQYHSQGLVTGGPTS